MLRWVVLILTFVLWLGCMAAVYQHCRPRENTDALPGMQTAMDAVFGEDVEPKRAWLIYLAPTKEDGSGGASAWDGVDETSLTRVGWFLTTLNRRPGDLSRVEQVTDALVAVPPDYPLGHMMGTMKYHSRADLTQDQGLENCSMRFAAASLEITALGVREFDELRLTVQISQPPPQVPNQPPQPPKIILDQQQRIPLGKRGAPNVGLLPFLDNPNVRINYSWDIATVDMHRALADNSAGTGNMPLMAVKARCTNQLMIQHDNTVKKCFVVKTDDGKSRAWYSADGVVLKQCFNFLGMADVILVQVEPKKIAAETRGHLGN